MDFYNYEGKESSSKGFRGWYQSIHNYFAFVSMMYMDVGWRDDFSIHYRIWTTVIIMNERIHATWTHCIYSMIKSKETASQSSLMCM